MIYLIATLTIKPGSFDTIMKLGKRGIAIPPALMFRCNDRTALWDIVAATDLQFDPANQAHQVQHCVGVVSKPFH